MTRLFSGRQVARLREIRRRLQDNTLSVDDKHDLVNVLSLLIHLSRQGKLT